MKSNVEKKQMRLSAQIALALTLGTAFVPSTALAAPITTSQTYTADVTVTDDVDIADGTITVEGVNDDDTPQHTKPTVILQGSTIKITNSSNILTALSRGGGTMDWSGILTINPDRTSKVQLRGDILVDRLDEYNNHSYMTGGYVNLYLKGEESYFVGGIAEVKDAGNNPIPLHNRGGVRLELSDGATWYPNGDSYTLFNPNPYSQDFGETSTDRGLSWAEDQNKPLGFHLSANGGAINMAFAAPNVARTAAAGGRTLTFANTGASLNGAAFRISTDLAHNHADKVVLSGVTGASNQYKLQVAYDPTMNDADTANYEITTANPNGIEVLRSSNAGDTVRALAYTTRKAAAAGLLTKDFTVTPTLRQEVSGGSKIAYLTKLTISEAPPEDGPALRAADLLMDMALAQLSTWRGENNDLHRRMGALRAGGASGAWVRGYGGRNEFGSYPTTGRYSGVQVGIDRAASLHGGTLFMGVAASTSSGTARNSDLDGSHRAHFFGVYGSYMGKRGDYIDAIVKYGRMTNDATAVFDGTAYTGGYGVNGWNISVEYGRRMPLRDHFYWTPQAELNYGHIGASSYTMRAGSMAGAHIDSDAVTSLIGRIGAQIGYEDERGTVYLKLGILHEFKADLHMRAAYGATSIDRSYSARDSYFEYGVGFARRVGRADLYGELSSTAGADAISEKWKANLGVRVEF